VSFGTSVTPLTNGNFVVTDPDWNNGRGAVYLYNGATLALVSTLKGSHDFDGVGSSVAALPNGNFITWSPYWANGPTGAITRAGAVTWGNGFKGVSGVVSAANSLVGSSINEYLGSYDVTVLANGNYLALDSNWNAGRGAVVWANGTTGRIGVVSTANSTYGTHPGDDVGWPVVPLPNGNVVIGSPSWTNGADAGAGAATWINGATGSTIDGSHVVSAANSLVGAHAGDTVGDSIQPLLNGNYVVASSHWHKDNLTDAGAVTWGNGAAGTKGTVSAVNSLTGHSATDRIGWGNFLDVLPLTTGNYLVSSPYWDNGANADAGAVTLGSGTKPTVGEVSASNSVVGTTTNDRVGLYSIMLTNGNAVISSPYWSNGVATEAGAATWISGSTGVATDGGHLVSAANSIVGSTTNDHIGMNIVPLTNGNFATSSGEWHLGLDSNVGAATWGNGVTGTAAVVSPSNSLVGALPLDSVGSQLTALRNSNYVVLSPGANINGNLGAGAATWQSGSIGGSHTGVVGSANSIVGGHGGDNVGMGGLTPLANGNYVLSSPGWSSATATAAGAATFAHGNGPTAETVTAANSLVGSHNGDNVGGSTGFELPSGGYLVLSGSWNDGVHTVAGAVTLGNGTTGVIGEVGPSNSLVGANTDDRVGQNPPIVHPDGSFIVANVSTVGGFGSITTGRGNSFPVGYPNSLNSIIGGVPQSISSSNERAFDDVHRRSIFGIRKENKVLVSPAATTVVAPPAVRLANTQPGSSTVDGQGVGTGKLLAGHTLTVKVAGRAGVPAGTKVVVLSVTSSAASAAGSLTVWPCGTRPASSTLAFTAGRTGSTVTITTLSAAGTVCVYSSAATNVVVDVLEHHLTGSGLAARSPLRVLDTRKDANRTYDHLYSRQGTRPANSVTAVAIAGRAGDAVPTTAKSAYLNLTVISGGAAGRLTVYPCGATRTSAISLSFAAKSTTTGLVLSKLGSAGRVCIFTSAPVNLVGDLKGHNNSVAAENAVNPTRILDTGAALQAGGTVTMLKVATRSGVPSMAYGVTLAVTVLSPTTSGRVVVYPCGVVAPPASDINHHTTSTTSLAMTRIGLDGFVCVSHSAKAHLVLDLVAYNP
jgi:hypothetical protein